MKYIITYKKAHNPNVTNYQNETRNKASRIFTNEAEAKAFAETVDVITVRNSTGKTIQF